MVANEENYVTNRILVQLQCSNATGIDGLNLLSCLPYQCNNTVVRTRKRDNNKRFVTKDMISRKIKLAIDGCNNSY